MTLRKFAVAALLWLLWCSGALAQAVTFDTLRTCVGITLSGGNLTAAESGSANDLYAPVNANIPASGAKVYFEFVQGPGYSDGTGIGMNIGLYNGYFYPQPTLLNNNQGSMQAPATCHDGFLGSGPAPGNGGTTALTSVGYFASGVVDLGANAGNGFAPVATWASWKTNTTNIGIAVDTVNKKMWARINGGQWDNNASDNPATNTGGVDISALLLTPLTPVVTFRNSGGGQITGQFASGSWSFAAPSGFSQLSAIAPANPQISSGINGVASTGVTGSSSTGLLCGAPSCDGSMQFNFLTDAQSTAGSRFPAGALGPIAAPLCDGVHDDAPALRWLADSITATVLRNNPSARITVNFPAGGNCMWKSCPSSLIAQAPFGGFTNVNLNVTGATMTSSGGCSEWGVGGVEFDGSQGVGSGGGAVEQDNFNSSSAGDTCVTMVNSGDEKFYPIGRWVTVAGQGLQIDSFPPNYANWEYAKVASTPTGQVCFTAPLQHAYPATGVVDLNGGLSPPGQRCANVYCGGPGRLVRMAGNWDGTFHVTGGTWIWDNEIHWAARTVINDNVTFTSGNQWCWFPSFIQTGILNNNNYPNCSVEVDKEIGSLTLNSSNINTLIVQSGSINSITLNNSNTGFNGTPPVLNCNNSSSNMFMGTGYGSQPESFFGTNCRFTTSPTCCSFNNSITIDGTNWTYTRGQIKSVNVLCNNGACPQPWWTTGGPMHMHATNIGNGNNELTVLTSTLDATSHTIVNVSLSGANLPPPGGTSLAWIVDPMRNWNCSNCTGSPFALEASMPPAQGVPIETYSNRTYTCTNNLPNVPNGIALDAGADSFPLFGAWQNVTVNVTQADTNPSDTGPLAFFTTGWTIDTGTGATSFLGNGNENIDLKHTGTRIITGTATIGLQGSDVFAAPGINTWVANGPSVGTANTWGNGPAAQCPVFNVTWQLAR